MLHVKFFTCVNSVQLLINPGNMPHGYLICRKENRNKEVTCLCSPS